MLLMLCRLSKSAEVGTHRAGRRGLVHDIRVRWVVGATASASELFQVEHKWADLARVIFRRGTKLHPMEPGDLNL